MTYSFFDICSYCGKLTHVRYDDDINAEKMSKICEKCTSAKEETINNLEITINNIMNVTPYTIEEMKEIKIYLDYLHYVNINKNNNRWWKYPSN